MTTDVRRTSGVLQRIEATRGPWAADLGLRFLRTMSPTRFFSFGAWRPELCRLADPRAVAITFDDGPAAETTPAVLEAFRSHAARATFFLSGVRAVKCLDLVEEIVRDGHDVYGHGWDHVPCAAKGVKATVESVETCERLLAKVRPTPSPYLIRLPYTAGHRSAALHRALAQWRADVQFVHYTATFNDWLIPVGCESREAIMKRVATVIRRAASARLGGKILLLHDLPIDGERFGVSPEMAATATVALADGLLRMLESRGLRTALLRQSTVRIFASKFFLPPRLDMVRVGPW